MQNQYRCKIMEILKSNGRKMNARDFLGYFPELTPYFKSDVRATNALSAALSDMFMDGLIFRNHRKCTSGNRSKFNYFANAEPEIKANPAADITASAENRDRAEIESLRCEVARLREQCEQHQLTEARNENEISDAYKKIHQLERMKGFTRVDCNRGYNVFAARYGSFTDEIYSLDEAIADAGRRAALNELDYVVVETSARIKFNKSVTVEVIGK